LFRYLVSVHIREAAVKRGVEEVEWAVAVLEGAAAGAPWPYLDEAIEAVEQGIEGFAVEWSAVRFQAEAIKQQSGELRRERESLLEERRGLLLQIEKLSESLEEETERREAAVEECDALRAMLSAVKTEWQAVVKTLQSERDLAISRLSSERDEAIAKGDSLASKLDTAEALLSDTRVCCVLLAFERAIFCIHLHRGAAELHQGKSCFPQMKIWTHLLTKHVNRPVWKRLRRP
jgi:chromosome segregation ATPase